MDNPDKLTADPPVIARIEADRLVLDPRTVPAEEERWLLRIITEADVRSTSQSLD